MNDFVNAITMNATAAKEQERRVKAAKDIIARGISLAARNGNMKYFVPKKATELVTKEQLEGIRKELAEAGYKMDKMGWDNQFTIYWDSVTE